jgi:hypothetical protein
VLGGFFIRQQFGGTWDVSVFVQLPLVVIASEWGAYIWQAGTAYQNYITGTPAPKLPEPPTPLQDWNTGRIVDAAPKLVPLNVDGRAGLIALNQVIDMPAFNVERNFAIDTLRMYDFDPATQKHVNLTEERWVAQKKKFSQKPFANLKKKWEHFGLLCRDGNHKRARFIVADRRKVALVASGNPLPAWSPTPPK